MSIADNLKLAQDNIARVCVKAGRQSSEITLVAVSKTVEAERVAEAIAAGVTDLGENWVQEGVAKKLAVSQLVATGVRWHMIGHVQTNKAKKAVEVFDVFQGVDSVHLARELSKRAGAIGKKLTIMLEVNTSGEPSKFGLSPDQLVAGAAEIIRLDSLVVTGLMTIGPGLSVEDPEKSRPCFRLLRTLKIDLEKQLQTTIPHLSMGMSSDYAVAIEEGATMLRIGTAIFGARQQ